MEAAVEFEGIQGLAPYGGAEDLEVCIELLNGWDRIEVCRIPMETALDAAEGQADAQGIIVKEVETGMESVGLSELYQNSRVEGNGLER